MKSLLYTQILFLKKRPFAYLFWLIFPLAATAIFMHFAGSAQSETRIPVAIALEDTSTAGSSLLKAIKANELLRITQTDEDNGLTALRKNKYDSLFIIPADFSAKIERGETKELIRAYHSERSLFFTPVKEMILANVQAASGRMQAAITVQQLNGQLNGEPGWTKDEIIKTADSIEHNAHLLQTQFNFNGKPREKDTSTILSPWIPWSAAALLTTFFIFDSIVKQKSKRVFSRLSFTRYGSKAYMLAAAILYTMLLLILDFIALWIFAAFYNEPANLKGFIALIGYRFIMSGIAFVFASYIKKASVYYGLSLLFTMTIVILSSYTGFLNSWNPIAAFSKREISVPFLALLLIALFFILNRKESFPNAESK